MKIKIDIDIINAFLTNKIYSRTYDYTIEINSELGTQKFIRKGKNQNDLIELLNTHTRVCLNLLNNDEE